MNDKKTIAFEVEYQDGYSLRPASGVWVTQNPQGSFSLNFYMETNPIPDRVVHELLDNGFLGKEVEREIKKETVNRIVTCGVVVDKICLKSIAEFLTEVTKDAI